MKPGLRCVCLLVLAIWPGTAHPDAHPNADDPVEAIKLRYEGKDYGFQYRGYRQPWVLDLGMATGKRDTPFHTLLSYYQVMTTMTDYGALMPYLRRSNGDAGEKPRDAAQRMAAIKTILAGDILIFGEILYGDSPSIFTATQNRSNGILACRSASSTAPTPWCRIWC